MFQRVGGDGFNVDASRVNYIRHLRKERQQSTRSRDVEFVAAKTRLMRLRIAQKERTLMMTDEAMAMLDAVCGTFRTALSSLPAQIGGRDLPERRRVEHICNAALQKVHDEAIAQAEKLEREMESEAEMTMQREMMTDEKSATVKARDRFRDELRARSRNGCRPREQLRDAQRRALARIAGTLDAVPLIVFAIWQMSILR